VYTQKIPDTVPSGLVRTKGLAVRKQPLIKAKTFIKCFIKKSNKHEWYKVRYRII
jgi:hypothetical protein